MKITLVVGSVREGRQSLKAAMFVTELLNKRGVETDVVDLANDPLPILGQSTDEPEGDSDRIKQVGKRIDKGDAVILVTPEYQGSFSGVLKNALDHFFPEFEKKPIGIVATSAGRMAGINASTQLQHVILSLGAYPVPFKLLVPEVHKSIDESFEPSSDRVANTGERFVDDFIWFADAIRRKKMEENETS
jgi:NAD(P)H-dependent FMN reductase